MMIKGKDDQGEYVSMQRWVHAWSDMENKNYLPGWCICELRGYNDGSTRTIRGEPKYLHESSKETAALHAAYMAAAAGLGA